MRRMSALVVRCRAPSGVFRLPLLFMMASFARMRLRALAKPGYQAYPALIKKEAPPFPVRIRMKESMDPAGLPARFELFQAAF